MHNENKILRSKIKDFRLLTESVSRDVLIDAVNKRHILYIYYAGDNTVNRGYRTIEPYAVGVHKNTGNIVVRAWQQAGATDTPYQNSRNKGINEAPRGAWRMFRIDGITSALDTMKEFGKKGVRDGYRKDGNDSDMSTIFTAVVAGDDGLGVNLDGISSYTDPDVLKTKMHKFDPKAQKTKDFYNSAENQEQVLKRSISDIYGIIKQRKENPSNFIVTNKNGRIWYANKNQKSKFKSEEIIGDLNILYRKYMQPTGFKINKNFIKKSRDDFEKELKKYIEN